MQENREKLGIVVSGSLTKGVEVRLDSSASVEDMAVGRYVTIEGKKRRFFGMITDISLGVVDQKLTLAPPDVSDPFMAEVLTGTSTYGTLHVLPMLTIGGGVNELIEGPQPVKTVPTHFSLVKLASQRDVELVFGGEDDDLEPPCLGGANPLSGIELRGVEDAGIFFSFPPFPIGKGVDAEVQEHGEFAALPGQLRGRRHGEKGLGRVGGGCGGSQQQY